MPYIDYMCACCAANVFGPDAGNEDVYNGSGCRDIVDSVLGGCNGEQRSSNSNC
jgi:hypothetical protein